MFKFVLLIASLAFASAGHVDHHHEHVAAPAVSYSTITRHHSPAHVAYATPVHHGYAHARPVLVAPALSHGYGYDSVLSHHGYAAAPLATKTLTTVAHQPHQLYHHGATYATHASYAPVAAYHHNNFNKYGHYGY